MRADPDHDANYGDRSPQAQHRAPVEQAEQADAAAPIRAPPAATSRHARLALARRLIVVIIVGFAFGRRFFGLVFDRHRNAVLRREAQFGKRGAKPELRLLAAAALFPSPRHTENAAHTGPAAR